MTKTSTIIVFRVKDMFNLNLENIERNAGNRVSMEFKTLESEKIFFPTRN